MEAEASPSSPLVERLYRLVPAFDSLRRYDGTAARRDLVAGLTVASVAVPQAMAYALIIGLPAEYGLYTAIVMTAVGALLDSSRQLINGPTNAISIAVLSAVATIEAPEARLQAVFLLSFLIGAIQLGITLLRLGDLTRYISHSVIVGFTAGASLLLVMDQTKNLFGLTAQGTAHDHPLYKFFLTLVEGGGPHGPTTLVGLGTIVLVLGLRWIKRRMDWPLLPEFLIVVTAMATFSMVTDLAGQGVKVIGTIPAKLPSFQVPELNAALMRDLSSSALAIALLGLLEAISMAKAIAAVTRQKLDLNQQCFSEGLANFTGSFFQCIPGSGSLTRSAINQQAGGQTQWSGVVSAAAVAAIMLVFAPLAQHIPRSALAGLLMLTALKMVDPTALRYHIKATRFDAAIVVVTAVSAFAISIEFCVLIGVVLSFLLAVPRAGRMLLTEFVVTAEGGIHERLPEDEVCGRILIFGLEGEMFFGAASSLEEHFEAIEQRVDPKTRVVVLRMKRARNPDAVGLALLEGFLERMHARRVEVILCGVRTQLFESFEATGLPARLGADQIFLEQPVRQTSTLLAIRHAYELVTDPCPSCPHRAGESKLANLYFVL